MKHLRECSFFVFFFPEICYFGTFVELQKFCKSDLFYEAVGEM